MMVMQKVILYYKFVPVADPETVKLWQRELCKNLGLKGRIIISEHGINGTLGGDYKALRRYTTAMNQHPTFSGITYKWSDGEGEDFPRLSVKVRPELVAYWAADELEVDENGVIGGGEHLKPEALHKLLEERGDEVVFFDGRNAFEAQVGKFQDAVVPKVRYTRDFAKELEDPKYDELKKKPVVTYCTGGIRCEVLSMMMKKRGFEEVYQIDGGIAKYGEKYGDSGAWEGKLYVFDGRQVTAFSDEAVDTGECTQCEKKTSNFENCSNKACNNLIVLCPKCAAKAKRCPVCAPLTVK
ncbi:MAG: rhodanese-related sulfurtransferase [Candidatus Saccharimonadales bacterium]|nr:rhodanese-related sulfurtransferase [Candidatus Saccharimonadales bacterium]